MSGGIVAFAVLVVLLPGAVIASTGASGAAADAANADLNLFIVILGAVALGMILFQGWLRLPPPATPKTAQVVLTCGSLFVLMVLIAPIAIAIAGLFTDFSEPLTVRDMVVFALAAAVGRTLVAFIASFLAIWPPHRLSADKRPPRGALAVTVVAILLILPIVAASSEAAVFIATMVRGYAPEPIAHETLEVLISAPKDAWFWLLIGMVVIAAPILEEITYREYLQQSLNAALGSAWASIIGASVIFAFAHQGVAPVEALFPLFVLGLGLGWLRERTRGLAAPVALHALFNLANIMIALNFAR